MTVFLVSEIAALDASVFKPRKSVRKVYAGRPRVVMNREVPTLQSLCVKLLMANIGGTLIGCF